MMKECGQAWKLGDRDSTVAMIQSRLQELGFFPAKQKCTGFYGEVTRSAVLSFQRYKFTIPKGFTHIKCRIWKARYWDGIVGPMTWKALWPKTINKTSKTDIFVSNFSSKLYDRPSSGWSLTEEEKKERYGSTSESIEEQLVTVRFLNKEINVHPIHASQFVAVSARIREYERKNNIKEYNPKQMATYNWRYTRGGLNMSSHAFGTAIDLDWKNNPMTKELKIINSWSSSKNRIPQYVIDSFKKEGAKWGGKFKSRKDYMHFEF